MPTRKRKNVIVTVDESHASDIVEVAGRCRAAGLNVRDSLEFLGQITGDVDPEHEDALRQVPGVLSVEESQEYQLPPPDSDIQ